MNLRTSDPTTELGLINLDSDLKSKASEIDSLEKETNSDKSEENSSGGDEYYSSSESEPEDNPIIDLM